MQVVIKTCCRCTAPRSAQPLPRHNYITAPGLVSVSLNTVRQEETGCRLLDLREVTKHRGTLNLSFGALMTIHCVLSNDRWSLVWLTCKTCCIAYFRETISAKSSCCPKNWEIWFLWIDGSSVRTQKSNRRHSWIADKLFLNKLVLLDIIPMKPLGLGQSNESNTFDCYSITIKCIACIWKTKQASQIQNHWIY